jgi:hypothetical protein
MSTAGGTGTASVRRAREPNVSGGVLGMWSVCLPRIGYEPIE